MYQQLVLISDFLGCILYQVFGGEEVILIIYVIFLIMYEK